MQFVRKKKRLADYDYSQPGAYFVTVCTQNRRCLLCTIVGADDHIGPNTSIPAWADDHIGPNTPTPVGTDDHIGPNTSIPAWADDHIGPNTPAPVGADDHIGPRVRLTKIGEVAEKYLRQIPGVGAYVVMPNHVHMILHISARDILQGPMWSSAPTRAKIPSLIRTWKTLVSKELGMSIWQRSYYDHVIRDEQDYLSKMQYIAENPAKWYFDDYFRW